MRCTMQFSKNSAYFPKKEIGEEFYPFTYNLTSETKHKALFQIFFDFF